MQQASVTAIMVCHSHHTRRCEACVPCRRSSAFSAPTSEEARTVTEPPSASCFALPVTIFLQIFDGSDAEEPRGPGEGGGKCVRRQPRLPGGWSLLQPENAPVICWGRPLPPAIPDHCQCAEWWQVAQGP